MEKTNEYHVHIRGGTTTARLNLEDIWHYRDLIWLFTKRTLALMYKQTILGPLWLILRPFLTSVVYAAVFKGIAGLSTDGTPALLFYLVSHALWDFFASALKKNSSTFLTNANVFGKVYFPRLTISISAMLTSLFEFLVELGMIALLLTYYTIRGEAAPNWSWIWLLPIVLIHVGALGLGLGVLVSSLTTKYRDLALVVDFGVSLWMYASPVVYPLSQLKNHTALNTLITLNPMSMPLEVLRYILLGKGTITPPMIVSSILFTVAALMAGILCFNKVEKSFIDTI